MSTNTETNWVEEIGKPTYGNIAEMVAALECDYERLEELRDEREALANALKDARDAENEAREDLSTYGTVAAEDEEGEAESASLAKALEEAELNVNEADNALNDWDEENGEELAELEAAAKPCGNECKDREEAEQMIQEDALEVCVRSDWHAPGSPDEQPGEFYILLSTGGPATRIMGELDMHSEPSRAWLEVQDWGKPWTEYYAGPGSGEVLLTYARCFYFAS